MILYKNNFIDFIYIYINNLRFLRENVINQDAIDNLVKFENLETLSVINLIYYIYIVMN